MLEKNKDYVEMRVSSTDCAFKQNAPTQISVDGCVYTPYTRLPDPGEFYILISKEKFDRLKLENQHYRELAKQFEENYNLLLKKTGFDTAQSLVFYLTNVGCDTLLEALASYVSERDKADENCNLLLQKTGFDTVEKLVNYLDSEAECDTLQEAVSKLKDQVKYTCDEWYSANSNNNSWKVAAECNSPKELIEKRETIEKEIQVYSRALQEWKEITGYPSPSAVKTALESGASWCHAYNEIKKANEKLADDVKSWKNVTGYSTPEDYMHARLNNTTPFDYTAAWQKATDCDTPEKAKERIKALNERIDESEADYNHLLCTTGFESESEIEDALDQCGHSTLRKALVDYEFDYEELLKLTGYKSNQDIRVALNYSEQFVYENMRELINSLKRKAKFTESNWQTATGCDTPGRAEEKLEFYKERLGKIVQEASCAAKHLENIMS